VTAKRIPFEREDERAMASAATWAMLSAVVSVISTLFGAFIALGAGSDSGSVIGETVGVAITVTLAAWLFRAGALFRKVATTDEADQRYLIEGFGKLRAYFRLVVILVGLAVIVAIVMLALGGLGALQP
jgi:hypothetical protein